LTNLGLFVACLMLKEAVLAGLLCQGPSGQKNFK
jgi:hypothetical protein